MLIHISSIRLSIENILARYIITIGRPNNLSVTKQQMLTCYNL